MVIVKLSVIVLQFFIVPFMDVYSDQSVPSSAVEPHRLIVRLQEPSLPSSDNCTFFKQIENVLTSTSEQLHNVTKGRLQWHKMSIVVSKSLANDCFRLTRHEHSLKVIKNKRINAQLAASHLADVVIHWSSHPLVSDSPHAKQYGGCGREGLGVHLSRQFIRSFHPSNSFISGRQVVREWVKHRYGVFDEHGFHGDLQYPLYTSQYGSHPPDSSSGRDRKQDNSCTTFANDNTTDTIWPPSSDEMHNISGHANATQPHDPVKAKHQTSIMASLDADDWCDGSNHIGWMPTKQNVLCDEQSIWQVMQTHPDFKPVAPSTTEFVDVTDDPLDDATSSAVIDAPSIFLPPQFEYILPSSGHRYVLVIDRPASSRRWSLIRRALYRWIHALPSSSADEGETHLSVIVSSSNDAKNLVVLGWTKVTADNRDGLVGRIPRRPAATPPSTSSSEHLVSAIRLAHQMLHDEKETTCCGGQLILLTGTSIEMQFDERQGVTVHTIAFPSRRTFAIDFGVAGLQLAVDDDEETSLTQSRLATAFLETLRYHQLDTPTQVYEETVTSSSQSGTFLLDAPLGANVRIVAHCADEADLDTVEVVSPNGRVYDLPLVSDGMLHIRIPHTDEFGEWSYRLKFAQPLVSSARHQVATTVEVTAQPATTTTTTAQIYDEAITVQAWTNVGRQPVNASQSPILLYAEVRRGQSPVIDAKVTAVVYPPTEAENSTVQGPFIVQLYDKGTGDPDITRADGIYSAYFTHAVNQPGHYAVIIQVTDNSRKASIPVRKPNPAGRATSSDACCGSSMPFEQTVLVQPFRRIISGPSFVTIDGPDEDEDVYPPGRISDLRVERIVNATNEVELGWTAPGTDYDSGSAAFYQIRCYTDRSALNDSASAILVHASLTPQPLPAGTWQKSMVAVPWPNQIFYYAIVAVDFAGLRGKVSNIVPVYIEEPPPPPTTTTATPPLPAGEGSNNATHPEAASQALTEQQMYAIAGGLAGFILLLVILSIAACLSRRKRSDDRQEKSSPLNIQVEPLKMNASHTHHHPADANQHQKEQEAAAVKSSKESRPVYKIYVNNAYIQEEDGELKIVTPDGRIIQRGSPWFNTLPRGRSLTNLEGLEAGTSATDLNHWSLPRAKTSPHRHKVLTNGSIMPNSGSQNVINNPSSSGMGAGAIADGTSISSKPSVSSDDTGIEVSDHQTDSRDSADLQMILPPPGFGPIQNHNGYMPMYANHNVLPPPSPGRLSQHPHDVRVMRIPSFLDNNNADHHHQDDVSGGSLAWLGDFPDSNFCSQPSSRRPLMIGSSYGTGSEDRTPQISPPPPSTPTSQSSVHQPRRKTRHISFV